jgi:hypothetical protein
MHNSVAATLKRKTTRSVILIAALLVISHVGAIAAKDARKPEADAQSKNDKSDQKKSRSRNANTQSPQTSCPDQTPCCASSEAQVAIAQINAAKDAAIPQNATLQTVAQIAANEKAAENAVSMQQKAVMVFRWVSALTGMLLVLILLLVAVSLFTGKWSLREALSEKPSAQPRVGVAPLIPSTSRFIALFGLLGILTILLGVGYAIVWNLLLYQKPPDNLSEIESFLLAAAFLFAPYVANQVRAAFQSSAGDKPPANAGAERSSRPRTSTRTAF